MNFKIDCMNFVMLYEVKEVLDVNAKVLKYDLDDDTLKGNVEINGRYLKDNNDKPIPFSDVVPFTVVFNTDDIIINEVRVEDFKYELLKDGIDSTFKVSIDYMLKQDNNHDEDDISNNHKTNEILVKDEKHNTDIIDTEDDMDEKNDILDKDNIDNSNISKSLQENEFVNGENDEEITNKYEEKLDEILNGRNGCDENEQLEEMNVVENIEEIEAIKNTNVNVKKIVVPYSLDFKEKKNKLRVIFYKDDKELEKISKNENISINKLLNNSQNVGDTRRIILRD